MEYFVSRFFFVCVFYIYIFLFMILRVYSHFLVYFPRQFIATKKKALAGCILIEIKLRD